MKNIDFLLVRNGFGLVSVMGNIIVFNSFWFVVKCIVWYYIYGWYRGRNESFFYCLIRLMYVESVLFKSRNEILFVFFLWLFINFIL